MSKIKIAVVEDEIIIADSICNSLEDLGYEALEPAISYSEAIKLIDDNTPDLVILDIQLSGSKDGIDLAWKIKEDYNIPFIFLTSNADKLTVDRAKRVSPPAYLVKPFSKDELYTSIEIALFNHVNNNSNLNDKVLIDSIFVKQNKMLYKVKLDEILFLQSDHVYIEIITIDNQKWLIRDSLNEYINKLNHNFLRVHRGFIVNLKHLEAINHNILIVGNHEVPIGKNYREQLLQKINLG